MENLKPALFYFPPGMEGCLTCTAETHAAAFVKWARVMPMDYSGFAAEIDHLQSSQGVHSKNDHPWHRFADRSVQRLRRHGIIELNDKRRWILTEVGARILHELKHGATPEPHPEPTPGCL